MENTENLVIPGAPVSAGDTARIVYTPPAMPVCAPYTNIVMDASGDLKPTSAQAQGVCQKLDKTVAFLLHLFLGCWGIGDFYCGRIGRGIAKLLTGGGFFIWALIDAIRVLTGGYKPAANCIFVK